MKNRKNYIIYCASYSDTIGGHIVLHKICDIINSLGYKAYMCPYRGSTYKSTKIKTIIYRVFHIWDTIRYLLGAYYCKKKYKTNTDWNTPIISPLKVIFGMTTDNYIVLYPEVVRGNPIGAKHVSRLLMNNPGYFKIVFSYDNSDLIFRYSNSFGRDFLPTNGATLSKKLVTVSYTPKCYHKPTSNTKRQGTAYCIRKGEGKPFVHEQAGAILIDNMPHEKIAKVFRSVNAFVSYDPATAFSKFALLCHCPSIIILGKDETKESFLPEESINNKFCYSMNYEDFDWESSYKWAEESLLKQEKESIANVKEYIHETQTHFSQEKITYEQ